MIVAIAHKTPGVILDKLNRLLTALQAVKNHYEQIGKRVQHPQLKLSILGLAQESKQYANELIAHIETLGGKLHEGLKSECNRIDEPVNADDLPQSSEILLGLKIEEQLVLKTYRDVLNEPYLYDTVRQMIRYQQNGLLHCFSQVRMLYATLLKSAV